MPHLYWKNANADGSWDTLANWFTDIGGTVAAAALPGNGDNVSLVDGDTYAITAVSMANDTFTIAGDHSDLTGTFDVSGSTANDGTYTVVSAVYGSGSTVIEVAEEIPDATVDGNILTPAVPDTDRPTIGAITVDLGDGVCDIPYSATAGYSVYNYSTINGGTFSGDYFNNGGYIYGGTFSGDYFYNGGSTIGGTFSGSDFYNNNTIYGGVFSGASFTNDNTIYGGTFSGSDFYNNNTIYGGTFSGSDFYNNNTIYGGVFSGDSFTNTGYIYGGTWLRNGRIQVEGTTIVGQGNANPYPVSAGTPGFTTMDGDDSSTIGEANVKDGVGYGFGGTEFEGEYPLTEDTQAARDAANAATITAAVLDTDGSNTDVALGASTATIQSAALHAAALAQQIATDQAGAPAAKRRSDTSIGGVAGNILTTDVRSDTVTGAAAGGTVDLTNMVAGNIKSGITIGGVTGTNVGTGFNTDPGVANVRNGQAYTILNVAKTGTLDVAEDNTTDGGGIGIGI